MKHLARQHPFAFGALLLIVGPYLLAFALLYVVAFVLAAVLDVTLTKR